MRSFLTRFLLVVLLLAALIGAVFAFNAWSTHRFVAKHQGGTIILGDSHAATNINPKILGARNFAHTAEPLLTTAQKLQWITTELQPDSIILVISPNNFAGYNDHKFSDAPWSSEMAKRYYSLFPWSFWAHYGEPLTALGHHFRKQLIPNPSGKPAFLGKFAPKPVAPLKDDLTEVLERHFNAHYEPISKASSKALLEIQNHCLEAEIHLIIVEAPLLPTYKKGIPRAVGITYNGTLRNLPLLPVPVVLSPDQFFNGDHLNKNGAQEFTRALKKELGR